MELNIRQTLRKLKIDSQRVKSVRKAGLTMYESLSLGTQKCPLSILTGVRIKRVNFTENI